jgi:hypothetical protein
VLGNTLAGSWPARGWYWLKHCLRRNSRQGSQRNIHAHYDLGNAFYELWLDPSWTYSSAWFDGHYDLPLATAQSAKYQRICDVLGLQPGMRVLEIGCGWGGFAEHASSQGIAVHGITISHAQLDFARQRLAGNRWCNWSGRTTATCTASTMPLSPSKCSKPWAKPTGRAFCPAAAIAETGRQGTGAKHHHCRKPFRTLPPQQ